MEKLSFDHLPKRRPLAGVDCDCMDCRAEREFKPCHRVRAPMWCDGYAHYVRLKSKFGYDFTNVEEPCPKMLAARKLRLEQQKDGAAKERAAEVAAELEMDELVRKEAVRVAKLRLKARAT